MKSKIFYTGFHKCATSSMAKWFRDLGFDICDHGAFQPNDPLIHKDICSSKKMMLEICDQREVFFDSPWFLFYEMFDKIYQDARFIHAIRDPESWYKSCVNYFGDTEGSVARKYIYGNKKANPAKNKIHWMHTYIKHQESVLNYFKHKENFLLIDIFNNSNLQCEDQICDFLDIPRTNDPIEHKNISRQI